MKREGVLSWGDSFMALAKVIALRSKDPSTQVGACIVDKNKHVVGLGYNGLPNGYSDEDAPWAREGEFTDVKYSYMVHAELNAILNSTKKLKGCTIYVSLFPCNECAKAIIQSGIKKVVYESDKYSQTPSVIVSKKLFKAAGVELIKNDELKVEVSKLNVGSDKS